MLPSPIEGQQYVAPPENDGGKLRKGHGKVGGDELLPGASLHTHKEAMQLLCILGNKLGIIRDICFVFGIRQFLTLSFWCLLTLAVCFLSNI